MKKGTTATEETRKKMSEARKAYYKENGFDEEIRKKMSKGMKAFWNKIKKIQEGNENFIAN